MKGPRVRWRWLSWAYAMTHAYFWLRCPICHKMFGGHEAAVEALHTHSAFTGQMVCWRCGEAARQKSLPVLERVGIIRSRRADNKRHEVE